LNAPDVLGMVLYEAIISLDKNGVAYTIQRIPTRVGDEIKTGRIIRQRIIKKSNKTELLIAYF